MSATPLTLSLGETPAPSLSARERLMVRTVVVALIAMVTVRFFTETVPILPRAANVIDILIFVWVVFLAALHPAGRLTPPRWFLALFFAFVLLAGISVEVNLTRVALGPALVFLYGLLGPLVVYWAVYRLWPPGHSRAISRVIIALGVLQLFCVAVFSLPSYLASGNPDEISGTFGENPYQLVFFLLIFLSVVAGSYVFEPRTLVARLAPALVIGTLVTIVLAEFRALLLTTTLVLVLLAVLLWRAPGRGHRVALQVSVSLISFVVVVAIGADHLKLSETRQVGAGALVSKRVDVGDRVLDMYATQPAAVVIGTGPGTYSSRGWATFAKSDADSEANVVGSYALALTGGVLYRTDVSDEFVRPWLGRSVAGSYSPDSPYLSYASVAAEVGIPALAVLLAIYLGALGAVIKRAAAAVRTTIEQDPLPGLLLAACVGVFTLLQMGFLENWLEVTRVTFISWILIAIATKEYDARKDYESAVS